jgi:hypothetical protein
LTKRERQTDIEIPDLKNRIEDLSQQLEEAESYCGGLIKENAFL